METSSECGFVLTPRQLLTDDRVLFAGYKLPHPLETHIVVKVQTVMQTSPEEVMDNCKKGLEDIFTTLEHQFKVNAGQLIG